MAYIPSFKLVLVFATILVSGIWGYEAMPSDALSLDKFETWMSTHERSYADLAEKENRYKIFKDNLEYIESFNAMGGRTFKLGVNRFADLTKEEFVELYGSAGFFNAPPTSTTNFRYENVPAPPQIDWVQRGAVTGIKDQHTCGSCWAFSAIAAVEGIHQLTTGQLVSLSEQELVNCVTGKSKGCHGGHYTEAFEFITKNGITSESMYPYEGVDGECKTEHEANPVVNIKGYERVPPNNETALIIAVANQPVSVPVDPKSLHLYKSGVLGGGDCVLTQISHAVTVVGYGETSNGMKYWLAKNSWGDEWGENGYIRVEREVEDPRGACGIAMYPAYPTT